MRANVWVGETLYEVATGNALCLLEGAHGATLHNIFAHSPDEAYVVAGGGGNYGTSDIWDTSGFRNFEPTGNPVRLQPASGFTSAALPVTAIAISPDSKFVLVRTLDIPARNLDNLTLFDVGDTDTPVFSFRVR